MSWKSRASQAIVIGVTLVMAGCASVENWPDLNSPFDAPSSEQRPSDEPLKAGKRHFVRGEYGLAERNFRAAVEANPNSIDSWAGLAASYDHLHRFDLADRAYQHVIKLAGHTPEILNNLGYHYHLMGDRKRALEHLRIAAERDPNNTHIRGNLKLIETWSTGAR